MKTGSKGHIEKSGLETSSPKVALLVHENQYGGGARQTFYLLEELIRVNAHPILISNARDSWLGRQIGKSQLKVNAFYTQWIQRAINPFKDLIAFLFIVQTLLVEKPDVMVTSGVKLMGLGSLAGCLCGIPQRFAIVRGQGAAPDSSLLKIILTMEKFLALLGTQFITVCEYDRQIMLAKYVCDPQQVQTIHNGTTLVPHAAAEETSKLKTQLGLSDDAFVVGMVGRLFPQKRYDQFIQLMEKLCRADENMVGLLIGEGEQRQELQQLIDQTGFKHRIFITGYVPKADIYPALDLSVLLTRYEGCANALLESAAAGLPIIADNVCGNAEVVKHCENGFVVDPGDIESAARYILGLKSDIERLKQMGAKGKAIIKQSFNREDKIKQMVQLFINKSAKPLSIKHLNASEVA